jgi:hypothetical protein
VKRLTLLFKKISTLISFYRFKRRLRKFFADLYKMETRVALAHIATYERQIKGAGLPINWRKAMLKAARTTKRNILARPCPEPLL